VHLPVPPNSVSLYREFIFNYQSDSSGNIVYEINLAKNNGNFNIILDDQQQDTTTTTISINLLESIKKINDNDSNLFNKNHNDLFIYKDEKLMYNIPVD
jgi:hypothetical protein